MNASIILLMSLLLLAAGCGKKGQNGWGEMVVPVVAAPAQQQAVEETIEAVGTLAANERVEVKSEADGTVEAIHFEEGQQVEAGQVLAELDQAKLRAALAEAEANLKLAETTRQRYGALLQTQAVAQQEVDQTEATWAASHALVERLTAELKDAIIRAPFAGMAGARLFSVGQFVPRGTTMTTVSDQDPMKVEFRIPERFLGQLKPQQAVKVETDAYPDTPFRGEVYFIDPEVEVATRTLLLKAVVPNPQGRLRQGMFARVALVMKVNEQAVVIPETALLHQGDLTFVYVIDGEEHAQMRPVTVGVRLVNAVEIIEGLQPGEHVVLEGHQKLHPGAKVAPRPPDPSESAPHPA